MDRLRFDRKKLLEIQLLALQRHQELISYPEAGDIEEAGGFLIQGDHYATDSGKMFFGINPAESEDGEFYVDLLQDKNGPWDAEHSSKEYKGLPYWQHCSDFFSSDNYLKKWITDATSTFICPWPTENLEKLITHPLWRAKGIMWQYSREIVLKMFEHCNPKVIIAVGSTVREILEGFFDCRANPENEEISTQAGYRYRVSIYQWRNSKIYELHPHFAYANNHAALVECAQLLSQQIQKLEGSIQHAPLIKMHRPLQQTPQQQSAPLKTPPITPIGKSAAFGMQVKVKTLTEEMEKIANKYQWLAQDLSTLYGSSPPLDEFHEGREWEDSQFEKCKNKINVEGDIFLPKLKSQPGSKDKTGSFLIIRIGPLHGPGSRYLELWKQYRQTKDWLVQFPTENDSGRYQQKVDLNQALAFMAGAWSRAEERGPEK